MLCGTDLRVPYVVSPDGVADERAFHSISAGQRNPVQVEACAPMVLYADGVLEAERPASTAGASLGWRTDRVLPGFTSMPLRDGFPASDAVVATNLGITGVLTPARFLRNIRLAIELRDFWFSSDPSAPVARFCAA